MANCTNPDPHLMLKFAANTMATHAHKKRFGNGRWLVLGFAASAALFAATEARTYESRGAALSGCAIGACGCV